MNITSLKSKFGILSFVFFSIFIIFSESYALECIYAKDSGNLLSVIVPANPDLAVSNGYTNESGSQVATWTDSKVYTNGDPFYFEIEGMWSPWSATYDLVGGDSLENQQEYAGLQQKKSNAIFCSIDTKNKDIEVFDKGVNHKDTEFDYISSILKDVNGNGNGDYEKIYYKEEDLRTCWLTAGEGLYIGFFGPTGLDSPDLATHLKLAEIKCDDKFKKDLNDDGVFTFNECIYKNICSKKTCTEEEKKDSTNMAYYTPGSARCDPDFYHKNKHSNEFPKLPTFETIGINDCYQDVVVLDDNKDKKTIRLDKTLFIFDANYLYKNVNKDVVGKDERIKFIIYDNYYSDNVGQYKINIYSGFTDYTDKGLIEKIVRDLEDVFIGYRNEQGMFENGILKTMYDYLVTDSNFNFIARMMVILYMAFLGLSFALGSLEYNRKELMKILLKLTFVLAFTTSRSWQLYDRYIIKFFYDGFMSIVVVIGNLSSKLLGSENIVVRVNSASMASTFYFIDNIILTLFSKATTTKILGLFFGVWYGFIVIPIIYFLILRYIYSLVNAIFPYIVMFIQVIFGLFFGPIFIVFSLFKTTEPLFKAWLTFLGGRFANMIFLFTVIYMFWMIIKQEFDSLLFFNSCKVPLWQAIFTDSGTSSDTIKAVTNFFSFGIEVWKANWNNLAPARTTPGFFSVCFSLIFIYFLIYLFDNVIKKLPTIVDSIFAVDGSDKGAGLKPSDGTSKFGGKLGGLFDNLNKSIKIKGAGITKFIGAKAIEYGKEFNSGVLQPVRKKTFGKTANKVKGHLAKPFDRLFIRSAQNIGDFENHKMLNFVAMLSSNVGDFGGVLLKILSDANNEMLTKEESLEKLDNAFKDFFDKKNKHGAFDEDGRKNQLIEFHKKMFDLIGSDSYDVQMRDFSSKIDEFSRGLNEKELLEKRKYYEERKEFAEATDTDYIAVARYDVILKRINYEIAKKSLKEEDGIDKYLEASKKLDASIKELREFRIKNDKDELLKTLNDRYRGCLEDRDQTKIDEFKQFIHENRYDIDVLSQDAKVKKEFYLDRATSLLSLAKDLKEKEDSEEILKQLKSINREESQDTSTDILILTSKDIENLESRLGKIEEVLDGISGESQSGEIVQEIVGSFIPRGGLVALESGIVIYDPGLSVNSEGGLLTPQGLGSSAESEQMPEDKKAQIEAFNEKIRAINEKMAKIINFNEKQNNN